MEKKAAIPVPSHAALVIQDIQSTRWGSVAEGYMFAAKGNDGLFMVGNPYNGPEAAFEEVGGSANETACGRRSYTYP
jgi:hypothetical protein